VREHLGHDQTGNGGLATELYYTKPPIAAREAAFHIVSRGTD